MSNYKRNRQPGTAVPQDLLGSAWAWESIRAEHGPWEIRPYAAAMARHYAARIQEIEGVIING